MNKNFLYISSIAVSSLLAISACSDETGFNGITICEGKTAIELNVGMAEAKATTRTITEQPAEAKLSTLPTGTTLFMAMKSEATDKSTLWTLTKAETGEAIDKVSPVIYSVDGTPRYWDDAYARDAAVSVYSICAPGGTKTLKFGTEDSYTYNSTPTTGAWSTTAKTLTTALSASTAVTAATLADDDVCYSNNTTLYNNGSEVDKRLKFSNQESGKFDKGNLCFYHAMSKITIRLIADEGFATTGVGATAKKFQTAPEVRLTSNKTGETNSEYCKTSGTLNILDGSITGAGTPAAITMYPTKTDDATYTVIEEALVVPGTVFAENAVVARINADGNIYYISSDQIRAAMTAAGGHDDFATKQGTEYVITARLIKTDIEVTATIKDWTTVTANTVEPKIDVTTTIGNKGDTGVGFTSFDFYMRDDNGGTTYAPYGGTATGTVADGTTPWSFTSPIYWPSHDTHYHMRGVYPAETTVTDNEISVANALYDASSSPTKLMIGAPEMAAGTMCDNREHTHMDMSQHGICAREAKINLNFRYMMSQVEVRLITTAGTDAVTLNEAVVEILNGCTEGTVDIHSRTVTPNTIAPYAIGHVTSEDASYRHAVVVPQNLTSTAGDLLFKITITNTNGTKDFYYATIKNVPVREGSAEPATISAWESGKHYVYTLDMRKTPIAVTATLTPWVTVTGGTEVWF